jgi:hypothetical protein
MKINAKKSKQKTWIAAYKSNLFNVARACRQIGIDRSTFYRWMEDPGFSQAVEEAKEEKIDFIESQLLKKIQEGDTSSIIFALKTLGKSRGFIERTEISGPEGTALHPLDVKVLIKNPEVRVALETIAREIDNGNKKIIDGT